MIVARDSNGGIAFKRKECLLTPTRVRTPVDVAGPSPSHLAAWPLRCALFDHLVVRWRRAGFLWIGACAAPLEGRLRIVGHACHETDFCGG